MQDADEAVSEPPEGIVVIGSLGALPVIERPGARGGVERCEGPGHECVGEPVVADEPGGDDLLLA